MPLGAFAAVRRIVGGAPGVTHSIYRHIGDRCLPGRWLRRSAAVEGDLIDGDVLVCRRPAGELDPQITRTVAVCHGERILRGGQLPGIQRALNGHLVEIIPVAESVGFVIAFFDDICVRIQIGGRQRIQHIDRQRRGRTRIRQQQIDLRQIIIRAQIHKQHAPVKGVLAVPAGGVIAVHCVGYRIPDGTQGIYGRSGDLGVLCHRLVKDRRNKQGQTDRQAAR